MVGAPVRRQQVAFALKHGLSQRRACALLFTSRSTLYYESSMDARDGPLIAAMTGLWICIPGTDIAGYRCSWSS
jgi:putative transposase